MSLDLDQSIWEELFYDKDIAKVNKAGYCTPRGGDKGGYQNHVLRNNRVIVPYERLNEVDLDWYEDGYVIRLFPYQCFTSNGSLSGELSAKGIAIGRNAFVLYRTHEDYEKYRPLPNWKIRGLIKNGKPVKSRGRGVADTGEYILRMPKLGQKPETNAGPPQGIFAPEYANEATNYLCKAMLAWLIISTDESPYEQSAFAGLHDLLETQGLLGEHLEENHLMVNGITCCPLCHKPLLYRELHSLVSFDGAMGLMNSADQVEGATRSTSINLFHIKPLGYRSLEHKPTQIGWGHAICNTVLGQRECKSYQSLRNGGNAVIIEYSGGRHLNLGYVDDDLSMIRNEKGDVWLRATYVTTDFD